MINAFFDSRIPPIKNRTSVICVMILDGAYATHSCRSSHCLNSLFTFTFSHSAYRKKRCTEILNDNARYCTGKDTIVSLVLSKDNINRMEDYIKGAINMGAKRIKFGVPSIAGRACDDIKHEKRFLLTDDDLRVAYRNSREFKRKYYRDISIGIWSHRSQEPKKPLIKGGKYDYMLPCGAGYMSYVISQNGRLRPCELLSEDFFDLGSYEKLSEYINGEFFTEYDDMVDRLHSHMCKHGVGLECVCTPIKIFYEGINQSQ